MGKFNGKISAEFTPPKTWKLEKTLSFAVDDLTKAEIGILHKVGANISSTGEVTCKKGMITDLASVPRVVWNVIAPWDVARAAIIHDLLYLRIRQYRAKPNPDMKEVSILDPEQSNIFWEKTRSLNVF